MEVLDDLFFGGGLTKPNCHPEESSADCPVVDQTNVPVHYVGASIYLLLCIGTIALLIYKKLIAKTKMAGMTLAFYVFLILFLFCRPMWLFIEGYQDHTKEDHITSEYAGINIHALDNFNKIWNRVCFCLFLFVFNSLLFYWIDTIHTTINVAFAKQALSGSMDFGFITPLGRKLFWLAAIVVSLLVLGLVIIRMALGTLQESASSSYYCLISDNRERIREANDIIISLVFLVYGALFLFYGTKLNCRVHKSSSGSKVSGVWTTEIFSILLLLCFALRFVMFSYAIVTGCEIDKALYVVLSYYIPELVPAILVLLSVNSKMFRNTESDAVEKTFEETYIDPLLKEEEENEMYLAGVTKKQQEEDAVLTKV